MQILEVDRLDSDDGEWEMQRELYKSKGYVFISDLSIYFGYGYQTLNKFLNYTRTQTDWSERAMLHGKETEPECVTQLREFYEDSNLEPIKLVHNRTTFLKKIISTFTSDVQIAGTPDAFYRVIGEDKQIIEIKCPFHFSERFETVTKWARAWHEQHKKGYQNAFIQAFAYALMFDTNYFKTCFYFKRGDFEERVGIVHDFKINIWDREVLLQYLADFQKLIEEKPKVFRDTEKRDKRKYINDLMKESLVSTNKFTYRPIETKPIMPQTQ